MPYNHPVDYKILAEGVFPYGKLIVDYQPDRVFSLPERFRRQADEIWQTKLAEAQRKQFMLYDGNIFSLLMLHIVASANTLYLSLGRAGYRDYVVTRGHHFKNNDSTLIIADPLAICCAVITSDNRILIGRRRGVDGSLNKYHIVGGFMDRDLDIFDGLPCPFHAIQREVREETGIELDLDRIVCLGAIYDNVMPHPELCFYAATDLSYVETKRLAITEREVELWEFIENRRDSIVSFLNDHEREVTSVATADLTLYIKHKFADYFPGKL